MAVSIAGIITIMISGLSLAGHALSNAHFYQWNAGIGMALNTSLCLLTIGLALLIIGLSRSWH